MRAFKYARKVIWFMFVLEERREVAMIIGAVLLVGALGLFLTASLEDSGNDIAVVGQAVSLSSSIPTETGMLYLLENACFTVENPGGESCYDVCHAQSDTTYCLPLEETCTVATNENCRCCNDISE